MSRENFFPCIKCKTDSESDPSILCNSCNSWIHSKCVPMSDSLLKTWSREKRTFLCFGCCHDENGFFNAENALMRLSTNPSIDTAEDIKLLMQTYKVKVCATQLPSDIDNNVDPVSYNIIRDYQPILLDNYVPIKTGADGNCLYRAVSLGLTGTEEQHLTVRLLTAIEIILNKHHYDSGSRKFQDPINDVRVVTSKYDHFLQAACRIGAYSELLHIYALSAALKVAIRSYYPSTIDTSYHIEPFNRTVVGWNMKPSTAPLITIMWSQVTPFTKPSEFVANHFVPLIPRSPGSRQEGNTDETTNPDILIEIRSETENNLDGSHVSDGDDLYSDHNMDSTFTESPNDPRDISDNEGDAENDQSAVNSNPPLSGPLENGFLDTEHVVNLLITSTEKLPFIPMGPKNNKYFVIDNTTNNEKRQFKKRSTFVDDCGVWTSKSGASPKTTYMLDDNKRIFKKVYVKNVDGALLYCTSHVEKGEVKFVPLSPQPIPDRLLTIQRYYTTLKADKTYRKRVTWIVGDSMDKAIVEYSGIFPGLHPHGNCQRDRHDYIRTKTEVMDDIKSMVKHGLKPKETYSRLLKKYDEMDAPNSLKQIKDCKQREKKKDRRTAGQTHVGNIADHFGHLQRLVKEGHPFVRSVIHTSGKTPCVVLYTDEQIKDIATLCCSGQTLLGFDKTFNLCDMHVTASCYKQLTLNRTDTKRPPLFVGPIFLHDNSDYDTYCLFFSHIRSKLSGVDKKNLVIGTDDERAMVNAITDSFHESRHVLCTRHLKQNTVDKLENDRIDRTEKHVIIGKIFGENGLIDSDDSICFESRSTEIETLCRNSAPNFLVYFGKRLKNLIRNKVAEPQRLGLIERNWSNNNCESINHTLKHICDWKSQNLTDFVQKVHDLVSIQQKDLRRAIFRTGQYVLSSSYRKFELSRDVWTSKTTEERARHLTRLRSYIPTDSQSIKSSDGLTIIRGPRTLGKKPGQRKRKRAEKTVTI